ncbi:MAG: thermonuclease family protein [Actinomycetota bacterium]
MARRWPAALVLALAFALGGCTWFGNDDEPAAQGSADDPAAAAVPRPDDEAAMVTGTVRFVIDGDTVELDISGAVERVRLLGIDAPESVHPSVPEQCFGAEAAAGLTELLPVGSSVSLVRDVEARDRFGRLLLYLYRTEDGLFVNEWLVRQGLADTSFFEPNTALAPALTSARSAARAESAGLWGACDGPDQPLE